MRSALFNGAGDEGRMGEAGGREVYKTYKAISSKLRGEMTMGSSISHLKLISPDLMVHRLTGGSLCIPVTLVL